MSWVQNDRISGYGGRFGMDASMDGDYAIVGAPYVDGYKGASFILQKTNNNWSVLKKLAPSDLVANDIVGWSVAIHNDTAAMSTYQKDGGCIYVFEKNQGGANNWGQVKKIPKATGVSNSFGFDIDLHGDYIVASDHQGKKAHVFKRDQGGANNWGEFANLTNPDTSTASGRPVKISNDYILVSHAAYNSNTGRVLVYKKNNDGTWGNSNSPNFFLELSNGTTTSQFGKSFAISENFIILC